MEKRIISPEAAAELARLLQDYQTAQDHMKNILDQYGVKSAEFYFANDASGVLWSRIRALQGKPAEDWRSRRFVPMVKAA